MSGDVVVRVDRVSKVFCRSLNQSIKYGVTDIARDLIGLPSRSERLREGEFWALENISFEVRRGEALALVGSNGAGKSTLLKMLNGILMPDRGEIEIRGRVGALIEVAAGFHPMLSGRENIYVNGAILGMTKREIDKQFDSIVDFSGIAEFIDTPVKFYSSGMFVRLGFSVAAHLRPDVLLVDEILAVGDMAFQGKCMEHISRLQRQGCVIILVSHNEELARRACAAGLLLDKGQVKAQGPINNCYAEYNKLPLQGWIGETQRAGNHKVEIGEIEFLDGNGTQQSTFRVGQPMTVRVHLQAHEAVDALALEVTFNSIRGYVASSADNHHGEAALRGISGPCTVEIRFPMVHLTPGAYRVSAVASATDLMEVYDWRRNSWNITVENSHYVRGAAWMPAEWLILDSSPGEAATQ